MKKTVLFLMALILGLGASAQKIEYDKVTDTGSRVIGVSREQFRSFSDRLVLSLDLTAIVNKQKDVAYFLDAYVKSNEPISAPAHARILIKTQTGEVISLESMADTTTADNIGDLNNIGGALYKTFEIMLGYKITPEEINQIIEQGVAKIRIELDGDKNYEKEWKKDKKISGYISKAYSLLQDAVSVDKRGSFEDDF